MHRAIQRGLSVSDFEDMTIGMIIDFCIFYDNEHMENDPKSDTVRDATQEDIDAFFGRRRG